jgi:kynurenine formamidase
MPGHRVQLAPAAISSEKLARLLDLLVNGTFVVITAALPLDVRKGFAFPQRLLLFFPSEAEPRGSSSRAF